MNEFDGKDLARAFDAGAKAQLELTLGGEVVKDEIHKGMKNGVVFSGIDTTFEDDYRVIIVKIEE